MDEPRHRRDGRPALRTADQPACTLERDDTNGTIIYPKHVHKALRRYLGIEESPGAQRFPFNSTEDFAFFG